MVSRSLVNVWVTPSVGHHWSDAAQDGLERVRPVLLGAEQKPDRMNVCQVHDDPLRIGRGRPISDRMPGPRAHTSRKKVTTPGDLFARNRRIGSTPRVHQLSAREAPHEPARRCQRNRGRWWASCCCHHGQSWATSSPHSSSSARIPLSCNIPDQQPRRRQRPGRLGLERPATDDEHEVQSRAQPVEVPTLQIPGHTRTDSSRMPRRRVRPTRATTRGRSFPTSPGPAGKQVGAAQGELDGVEGPHAHAGRHRVAGPRRVVAAPNPAPAR
jgi:hypothetical protein